jgi:hypothetical protein
LAQSSLTVVTPQQGQSGAVVGNGQTTRWTGPNVTEEETLKLHKAAIDLRESLIKQQQDLISGKLVISSSSNSQALSEDEQREQALLKEQEREVQAQIAVSTE